MRIKHQGISHPDPITNVACKTAAAEINRTLIGRMVINIEEIDND